VAFGNIFLMISTAAWKTLLGFPQLPQARRRLHSLQINWRRQSLDSVTFLGEAIRPGVLIVADQQTSRRRKQYIARKVDFEMHEGRNRRLGLKGEELVVNLEKGRLIDEGRSDLAQRIERISLTQGDGAGYDILSILSFDADGAERYIEVKTTNQGKLSGFLVTANEVSFSEEFSESFYLYRVFSASTQPRVFVLKGSLRQLSLEPSQFRAAFS